MTSEKDLSKGDSEEKVKEGHEEETGDEEEEETESEDYTRLNHINLGGYFTSAGHLPTTSTRASLCVFASITLYRIFFADLSFLCN